MAHPLKHAESSARKFGGKAEDYLPIHNWFDESKPSLRISGIALFGTTAKEFSYASASSVSPSPTAKASRFRCATSENNMCARIWGAFPRHKTGYRKSSLPVGCTGNVSPIRAAGHASRFHPQRRKPSALNSMHLEQWHLRSSLPDISKWPHLAQTNAPSARAIIGMNSLPTTQYGHRTTRSVIAATPLAVEVRNKKIQKPAPPRSHPRTTRVARNVKNYTQSTRQQ